MNNNEKLNSMTIEEKAEALRKVNCSMCEHSEYCDKNIYPYVKSDICLDLWIDWLESEAENGT